MYNRIMAALSKAMTLARPYSTEVVYHIHEFEDIAREYDEWDDADTRYSALNTIDDINDELCGDFENDFYNADGIYDYSTVELLKDILSDVCDLFELWTDEMRNNTYTMSHWNA